MVSSLSLATKPNVGDQCPRTGRTSGGGAMLYPARSGEAEVEVERRWISNSLLLYARPKELTRA